jgi:hypothetical protein
VNSLTWWGLTLTEKEHLKDVPESPGRRRFLSRTGRFAAVTTPAVTLLLSTSLEAGATSLAASGKGRTKKEKIRRIKRRRAKRRAKLQELLDYIRAKYFS